MGISEEFRQDIILPSLGNYLVAPSFGFEIEEVSRGDEFFLVDACVDHRPFNSHIEETFTTTTVAEEAEGKWRNRLPRNNILESYTCADVREAPNSSITLTAFDQYGPEATIRCEPFTETVFCENCSAPCNATLTNDYGDIVYICSNLSSRDQSLLIRLTTFPKIFTFITNDKCLGWSSSSFRSYSLKSESDGYHLLKY